MLSAKGAKDAKGAEDDSEERRLQGWQGLLRAKGEGMVRGQGYSKYNVWNIRADYLRGGRGQVQGSAEPARTTTACVGGETDARRVKRPRDLSGDGVIGRRSAPLV